MNVVIQVDPATFQKMQATYPTQGNLPTGASFQAKLKGVTVTGYTKSRKVMFQGQLAQEEAQRWQANPVQKKANLTKDPSLPADFSHWSVLGSDEVGAGSYFGPLTTAAVYVAANQVDQLTQLGIQDSKKLTDPQIIKLAEQIIALCPYTYLNLMPEAYNQRMQKYNQAQLKALCHNIVLAKTLEKIAPARPQAILIDQFVQAKTYYHYLTGQPQIVKDKVYFRTKGEQVHVAVAAASIVARYYSLQAMDALSNDAGMTIPIGANHAVDEVAAKLIRQGQQLGHFAKLHFGNTQKAQAIANQ
ncbi:ribonuclease HIII [Limosilactobacillus gastricus]|uniref:Ribonuclease HIII n=1 Tax=Limosilactobacillus gastricus DSM 16045 TaxID=1423749 RepID=A0A0R1VCQ4_9LACO|nr:ribonuclease HIII [Limosilactobacillus gastricus]KRM03258.1 Ribonuclease [Limosilactobacillus gastricus DSM 16045]QGF40133.1 ribonuclease HIII [Limosilactobacillus gastricus]